MDEPISILLIVSLGIILIILAGVSNTLPTKLPNDCILYEDAIYCPQEVTE